MHKPPPPIAGLTPEERERFRITADGVRMNRPVNLFPETTSARRSWIYELTGPRPKRELDNSRDWYLLNYSINHGLKLGLDEPTLKMLSLMDFGLGGVSRWVNMRFMNPLIADSTAAHTKQVMNDVQHVFEQAAARIPNDAKKTIALASLDKMRKQALIGAWLHDMGEVVTELTTASDMFDLHDHPEDQKIIGEAKEAFEEEILVFALELALKEGRDGPHDLFIKTIRHLRDIDGRANQSSAPLLGASPQEAGLTTETAKRVCRRVEAMRKEMDLIRQREGLPSDPDTLSPEVRHMLELYDLAEKKAPGNFLHPVIKTVESVEGQRYLQKNSYETEQIRNYRRLADAQNQPQELPYHALPDHEIVSACARCERRLPNLYEEAGDDLAKRAVADAVAAFTYRSLARGFDPLPHDRVGTAPACIDRAPPSTREMEDTYRQQNHVSATKRLPNEAYRSMRAQATTYNESRLAAPGDLDGRFQTSTTLGSIYRAAEHMAEAGKVTAQFFAPTAPEEAAAPERKSLIQIQPGYTIPEALCDQITKDATISKAGAAEKAPAGRGR